MSLRKAKRGFFILLLCVVISMTMYFVSFTQATNFFSFQNIFLNLQSEKLPQGDKFQQIQADNTNIPALYWIKNKDLVKTTEKQSCARLPSIADLSFSNTYWQVLETSNGTFHIYSAFYDDRKLLKNQTVIRIIGVINRASPTVNTTCQIRFEGKTEVLFSTVESYKLIWFKNWKISQKRPMLPYLITCPVPKTFNFAPSAVSLVEKPCDTAKNMLRVIHNVPDSGKKDFAVCVKGLDFPDRDLSLKLVEWIELLTILGVNKIFIYLFSVHPNVQKVLAYYQARGIVSVTPLTLPADLPNLSILRNYFQSVDLYTKRVNEVIPYNDCFYQNLYSYAYIAVLDIDEVIVPKKMRTWMDLIDSVSNKSKPDTYRFRNTYFLDALSEGDNIFDGVPNYMHMLRHIHRTNYTKPGHFVKTFFDTDRVLTVFNHYAFSCLNRSCVTLSFSTDVAHLQHYRMDCVKELRNQCEKLKNESEVDRTLWKYKDELIQRTNIALEDLGWFQSYR